MLLMKNKKTVIFLVSFLTLIFPFLLGSYLDSIANAFENLPLHAVLEGSGAMMAFTLSMFIFLMYRIYLKFGHFHWTAIALTGMGIFDFFHAFMSPGELFVWFHSLAVFVGGVLFALVWLEDRTVTLKTYYRVPIIVIVLSVAVAAVSLAFPGILPRMIEGGEFSGIAIWLNIIGGIGFIVAGISFLIRFYRYEEIDELLFAGHTFLFGISGLLFATSYIWEPSWWLWHFLRFAAYLIALYYTYLLFAKKSALLHSEKLRLIEDLAKNNEKLLEQSRMAQMGEMISMIAHQWRQPLSSIAATNGTLQLKIQLNSFDLEQEQGRKECHAFFYENLEKINSYVQNLTTTIDDFRNFYKPNKSRSRELISKPIDQALDIVNQSLVSNGVEVVLEYGSKRETELYVNEMMQVIMNLLKNAQDNFSEKGIDNAKIVISSKDDNGMTVVEIYDNGGGIAEESLHKIFDPYFSTKTDLNGTGLGLYMSKIIVEEHHNGKLSAFNIDDGACFRIELRE